MVKTMSFSPNKERINHLRNTLKAGEIVAFEKQAWEWITTGIFTRSEFAAILQIKWEEGYNEAEETEAL